MKLNLVSLLFTFLAILSLMIAYFLYSFIVFSVVGLSSLPNSRIPVLRWPLLLVLATVASAAIYRYGPSRREARWRWLWRKRRRGPRMADQLGAVLLVHRQFRRL